MRPDARVGAAISILDEILAGQPAEQALLRWSRNSRFAGSGDRAAIRDLVFQALRRRNSCASLGGAMTGRGLMIGLCRLNGQDPTTVFTGQGHAPQVLSQTEALAQGGEAVDLPDWVLPMWRDSLGDAWQQVADAMGERAPVWLRVNPVMSDPDMAIRSLAQDGVTVAASPLLATALRVEAGERQVNRSAAYQQGMVELQDLSAQLACAALPDIGAGRVLDYCAGGGGKALAIAGAQPRAKITAHDANEQRMADLPLRAKRAGARIVAEQPKGSFDLVVADVPCYGSGTWRRTPDAKWRLDEAGFHRLLDLQQRIMAEAAAFVAPGGVFAYMTCSVLEDENGDQVDRFLTANPDFRQEARHFWTPLTASDGFFCAVLRKG